MDNPNEDEALKSAQVYVALEEVRQVMNGWVKTEGLLRLVNFTSGLIKQRSWYGERGGHVAVGKTAEDFVQDVILKVYSGDRRWNRTKYPEFYVFMCKSIRSEIYNACHSVENQMFKLTDFNEATAAEGEYDTKSLVQSEVKKFVKQSARGNSPLEKLITTEEQSQAEDRLLGFMTFIEAEEDLTKMFQCIMKGTLVPRELAKELNITVEEVQNLKKRMRRRYLEFFGGSTPKISVVKGGVKHG